MGRNRVFSALSIESRRISRLRHQFFLPSMSNLPIYTDIGSRFHKVMCVVTISYSNESVAAIRLQDLNTESSLVVFTAGGDCISKMMYSQQYPEVLFS